VGLSLQEEELFKSISQRSSIPGGTCSFDSPAYYHWLYRDEDERRRDIEAWVQPLLEIRSAIDILLNFIRSSAMPVQEVALGSFFQKTLDHSLAYQLLRVGVPRSSPYFAEISGGKHRFTIRFMRAQKPFIRAILGCCTHNSFVYGSSLAKHYH